MPKPNESQKRTSIAPVWDNLIGLLRKRPAQQGSMIGGLSTEHSSTALNDWSVEQRITTWRGTRLGIPGAVDFFPVLGFGDCVIDMFTYSISIQFIFFVFSVTHVGYIELNGK